MSHEHHHHSEAAAAAAPAKKVSVELSAEDKHFKPEVVSWKELNKHERKAVAHYAVGKGALAVFPFVAATFAWNASFYTKVAQTPQAKVMQAGVAFVGAAVAADLLHLRLKKPVRAYLTQHNSFISQATLDGYGFVSAVTNRLRDIVGVHE